jgi:hypothetical protein
MPNFVNREGEAGSLNIYYKGYYISKYPLDSLDTFDKLCNESLKIIKGPSKDKLSLKQRLWCANAFIEVSVQKMKRGDRIKATDHILLLHTMLMLIQFKVIDNDESNGYLICKKYKGKKKKRINNLK